ncbi:MAG TPA: 3D domain-containing protein [Kofleriaceae bacterium]|nr:3D domain-containing protein [Kofleriaceae bacterium]
MRLGLFVVAASLAWASAAHADDSKLAKEQVPLQHKATLRGKNKLCCGYPLVDDQQWALRFYWLTQEADYQETQGVNVPRGGACALPANKWVEIYTREGFFIGRVQEKFACSLKLEGSGLMMDDRVINYTGKCPFGYGTCFETLDPEEHPFGRGAGTRPLIPFKSVAVDSRHIQIGEPIYVPEFDGLVLPDGSIHDGCVRADDTGGGIKKRKMDFFVVTYGNFRFLLDQLLGVTWITPHIEAPRCEYLRDL